MTGCSNMLNSSLSISVHWSSCCCFTDASSSAWSNIADMPGKRQEDVKLFKSGKNVIFV